MQDTLGSYVPGSFLGDGYTEINKIELSPLMSAQSYRAE